jgi:hypothetical protein
VRAASALALILVLLVVPQRFAAAGAPWRHGDPNAVVRTILVQPGYAVAPKSAAPAESIFARALRWLADLWQRLFGGLKLGGSAARIAADGAVVVLAAALVWLAFVVFRIAVGATEWRRRGDADPAQAGLETAERAASLRAAARVAAERGDHGLAIVLLFRAALAALDERSLVAYDASRTPGEYRRLVRLSPAAASSAQFDELTARFVRASFAKLPASRADYDAAAGAFAAFDSPASDA